MSINFENVEVQVREDRLNSISGFFGTLRELSNSASSCSLQNKRRCFSENSSCMAGCAQGYLSTILDAAIVNHAPIGCASDAMGANNARKWGEYFQGIEHKDVAIYNTNMTEQDTIFGAQEKLRETILSAFEEKNPKAIFITSSCTSAIIGEDVGSLADDLLKTRLLPSRFYTIADSFYSLGLTRFLINDMGLIPETQFITDNTPDEFQTFISEEYSKVNSTTKVAVEFISSSGLAQKIIREKKFRGKPLILGSGWEKTFSQEIHAHFLPLAAPLLERMVLNRSYAGYSGALTLLEDICSLVLSSYQ